MRCFFSLLLLMLATRLTAQVSLPDLRAQNAGGTVVQIHEVKLLRVDPDGIRVVHSAGTAKIPYELLPEDLQTKFGFNADQAKQHREEVTVARQAAVAAATAAQVQAQAQAQAQVLVQQSTPVTSSRSTTYHASSAAAGTRTSLGYTLPAIGSTRSSCSSSRYRSRYNYCPSCTAYSAYSYSYPVYYYNPGSTSVTTGGISMGP